MPSRSTRFVWIAAAIGLTCSADLFILTGCGSTQEPMRVKLGSSATTNRDLGGGSRPLTATEHDAVVAIINGSPLRWAALADGLYEAAGGQVLREVVLDAMIDVELRRAGLTVTTDDITSERKRFERELALSVDANTGARLTDAVLRGRGLGPSRSEALVRRSASLRKLVIGSVRVSDAEIRLARSIREGPQHTIRVIETPYAGEASALAERLRGSSIDDFARAAGKTSIDATASQGGLIGAISLDDPSYPQALRDAAKRLQPGQTSGVIGLDRSFVILRLDDVAPGRPSESGDDAIRATLRDRKERVAMSVLGDRLLRDASVSVLSPSLGWSWDSWTPTATN